MQPINEPPRNWADTLAEQDQIKHLLQGAAAIEVQYGAERWTVASGRLGYVSDLSEYMSEGSRIDSNIKSAIHRSIKVNFDSTITEPGVFPYLADFVKPYMIFTDQNTGINARFNLGMYVLESPTYDNSAVPSVLEFTGYDMVSLLDIPFVVTEEVPVGSDPAMAAAAVIRRILPWLEIRVDPSPEVLRRALAYLPTDNWTFLTVVNDLLASINYMPVWADWDGVLRIQPKPRLASPITPDGSFESGLVAPWQQSDPDCPVTVRSSVGGFPVHSGTKSLEVSLDPIMAGYPGFPAGILYGDTGRQALPILPGDIWRASAWFKAQTATREVYVSIFWWDKAGHLTGSDYTIGPLNITTAAGWTQLSVDSTAAPADAVSMSVAVVFNADGATTGVYGYIDDIEMTLLNPRPAEWVFDVEADDNVVAGPRHSYQNMADVPNLWQFAMQGADTYVEGETMFLFLDATVTYAAQAGTANFSGPEALQHPGSIDNRKRIVPAPITFLTMADPSSGSYSLLRERALAEIAAQVRPGEKFDVTTSPFPLAWHWDQIEYRDPNLSIVPPAYDVRRRVLATQWTLPLDGKDMTWTWESVSVDAI